MEGVSVILCCYNSAERLPKTLQYLANQKIALSLKWELILVNNNSTDNTVEEAQELWKKNAVPTILQIIDEPNPGLSFARIAGVKKAQFSYVLFCDDDNWLQEDYLQTAYTFMDLNPKIGVLGGQSVGVLEGDQPNWWEKQKINYAVGKQAVTSGDITNRGFVWGAGMIFRKEILTRLFNTGFTSLLSDRKGAILSSGGDSELCKWSLLLGYKLWYLESLQFSHFIEKERLMDEYLQKLLKGHKQAQPVLSLYNWFFKKGIYKKVNELSFNDRARFLWKSLNGYLKKKKRSREHLQLAFGNSIKIYSELNLIIRTYKYLSK
jgi:glycosyltransferase involved in cell wall biosynthesis